MEMNYKVKTDKSFEKAVEDLKQSLSNNNFGVLWEMNFKEKLKEKELDFENNFKILEVCNPKQAKEVLEKNIEVGFFLPCKMVVYEDSNSVFIGMTKPTKLIETIEDEDLSDIAMKIEKILISSMDEAK